MPWVQVFQPLTRAEKRLAQADVLECLRESGTPWMWSDELPADYADGHIPGGAREAFSRSSRPPFDTVHIPVLLRGSRARMERGRQPGPLATAYGDRAVRMLRITAFDIGEFERVTAPIAARIRKRYPSQRSWPWAWFFHSSMADKGHSNIYLHGKEYRGVSADRVGLLRQMLKLVEVIDEAERRGAPAITLRSSPN